MVVKSKMVPEHVGNLGNIFEILRKHKLRLNASKCSFGVGSGKFLGYMVTHHGIEVNLNQVKAINSLQPPRNAREVQKLTGMTDALNRFISRSVGRCRPFFQLSNKWKGFEWIEECSLAFQQLKKYLSWPPVMSRPKEDEVLFSYIVVASHAVSLVLVQIDNGVQRPIYYVSKSLHEAEICYLLLENAILALSVDYTGRIAKWGTILGAFDIKYMPHTSVKGQVLAD
ncbi:putative mitochondrial protein AtMg00860 [Castanea sativa]|uniref:putative mitochondrial protein AtMg00860 n=1 Tax=Castanea sativa TaxID=21020 RepID=UPI003F64CED0